MVAEADQVIRVLGIRKPAPVFIRLPGFARDTEGRYPATLRKPLHVFERALGKEPERTGQSVEIRLCKRREREDRRFRCHRGEDPTLIAEDTLCTHGGP